MEYVDRLLNRVTMYRLLVYVLGIYVSFSLIFAMMGRLASTAAELITSLGLLIGASYGTDRGLSRLFRAPTNMESSLLSALIMFLIIHPAHTVAAGLALVLAGAVSSISKFLISWHGKHIFNPAAFAAALLSLTGLQATTWWIGNSLFWPVTLVLGLAVVRKIRRFPLVLSFFATGIGLQLLLFIVHHQSLMTNMRQAVLASPLLFLGTIMLTEPATMPPRRNQQMIFGGLVAILYVTAWGHGSFIIYPEVALLLGNLYAFIVSPKFRVRLQLLEIQRISDRVYNYVFKPEQPFKFLPGQYMEWTLANVPYDSRGNRRTFTIASSPTEPTVQLGLTYYEPASSFKASFRKLKPGDSIFAGQLAGNFTLNGVEDKKLVFIAGGVGITPFRSMITYLSDQKQACDIILLYIVSDSQELAYLADLRHAERIGVKTIPIVTDLQYQATGVITAKLTSELLAKLVPDYAERDFYISGPNTMVDASRRYLRRLSVGAQHIRTDHFSGY